jgi:predicted DNA-binding protein (UPF0251 family)
MQTQPTTSKPSFCKSVSLTEDEKLKLKHFGGELLTQHQKATKLGITRSAFLRALMAGSGRGDNIKKIKDVLSKEPLPNIVGQS